MPLPRVSVLVLTCLLGASSLATVAAGADTPPPLTFVTKKDCTAGAPQKIAVPTRGGTVAVTLTVPTCKDPARSTVPVVLTYTPYQALYRGADPDAVVAGLGRAGFARAVADVVGTGESGGCWDYGGARESASAFDLVEWLGTRPWSNGRVAMIGGSYDGTTANMAAVAHPPHLATIVPQVAISDWYSYAYGDGVRYAVMDPAQRQGTIIDEQGLDTPVSFDVGEGVAPPLDRNNPNLATHAIERPCPGMTDKLEHTERGYSLDPNYDDFWRARGYVNAAASVDIPVLVQGGWRDYNVKHSESTRWFTALTNAPFKMLTMGQQAHGMPDFGKYETLLHSWFDQFLYGFDTGLLAQPGAQSKTNDGIVHVDATWPPPGTAPYILERTTLGDTLLDPGTMTESTALASRGTGTSTVLWLETPAAETDVRITGTPLLSVDLSTAGTSTHLTPVWFDLGPPANRADSLCQFVPAQDACVISRGFLNARYRDGLERGRDLVPGAPFAATIRGIDTDWVIKAGHRVGVALMASNAWWAVSDPGHATSTITKMRLSLPVASGSFGS